MKNYQKKIKLLMRYMGVFIVVSSFFFITFSAQAIQPIGGLDGGSGGGLPPTVSIRAGSTSLSYGGSTTITWSSSNATSCVVGGPNISSTALSGSASTGSLISSSLYTIRCQNAYGPTMGSVNVSVTIPLPVVSIKASPTLISTPQSPILGINYNASAYFRH